MKTSFRKTGLFIIAGIALSGCSPGNGDDAEAYIPTAATFGSLRGAALEVQTFNFNAEDGITTFTTAKGVQVTINGSCLTQNGNAVTGPVVLEYSELFDAGSMLVSDKTTMGKLPNGDMALLISGGEFHINATQNGQPLDIGCPMNLVIPANLTGGTDNTMTLWDGTIDADGNLEWEEQQQTTAGGSGIFIQGPNYNAIFNGFGWTNVDRFYYDTRPKTTILAEAPTGYNYGNSGIYLHYDGVGVGLAKLDTFDAATQQFSEHYGQIPVGLECHIIFVTEADGQWKYAIKSATIAANAVYVFTSSETTIGTEAQLIAAINALP